MRNGKLSHVRLKALTSHISSGSTPRGGQSVYLDDGPVMLLRSQNVRMNRLDLSDVAFISDEINAAMQRSVVQDEDVLLNITGASIGRVSRFAIPSVRANVNQHVCIIRPRPNELDSRYLTYFLSSPKIQHEINNQHQRGGTRQALTFSQIGDFEIPLPSLSEQKRIANILDKADAIRRKRCHSIIELLAIVGSIYAETFGTPSNNTKGYPVVSIRDLVSEVKYGTSSKAGAVGEFPILRMNNVTYEGVCDFSDLKYIDIQKSDQEKYLVRRGDLLFNRTNSKELVGKTAVYQEEKPMAFAGYLVRARTNAEACPEYIAGYLNSPHGKATLRHMCKSIVGMANINAQEFQSIEILKPPIEAQREFVRVLDAVRKKEHSMQIAADESNDLFNSLVQRAFKGEL